MTTGSCSAARLWLVTPGGVRERPQAGEQLGCPAGWLSGLCDGAALISGYGMHDQVRADCRTRSICFFLHRAGVLAHLKIEHDEDRDTIHPLPRRVYRRTIFMIERRPDHYSFTSNHDA